MEGYLVLRAELNQNNRSRKEIQIIVKVISNNMLIPLKRKKNKLNLSPKLNKNRNNKKK